MKYKTINYNIISRYGLPELSRRLRHADIAAIDLDDCLYPRNSHVELTKNLFLDLPYSYQRLADLRLMLRVVRGLALALCYLAGKIFRTHVSNRFLLEEYEQVMRNMPVRYFDKCAAELPRNAYNGTREVVKALSERMPVGIITVGFDMVVGQFMKQFVAGVNMKVSFIDANKAVFSEYDGEKLYNGFARENPVITAEDKWRHLKQRLEEYKSRRPLIIGHRADEILMARHARELGGLSIGFNPDIDVEGEFDVIIKAKDWTPILDLLDTAFLKGEKSPSEEKNE